ncbi:MAG TPA: DNA ligase D [Casimicrobiaceae bacterium]|nr:DNA ligase D [Casimicrobiaceae bacterium]
MALERYRQKRDFAITPEPAGKMATSRAQGLTFVVQKHAATRLHFDFRLELDGVLLSWAVPKGPSLDPNDKRLAMHVEDHPLEYGDFEGVIPAKQYGAGTVMVWDRGTWRPTSDPKVAYARGHLKFELFGDKLKGTWNLVRSRSGKYGGDKSWLLFKEADDHARLGGAAQIIDDRPDSVLTGRSLAAIAAQSDRVWHSNRSADANVKSGAIKKRAVPSTAKLANLQGAIKSGLPDKVVPQLATLTKHPPVGPNWVHEIKFDGYRMLARIENGSTRMMSRAGKDWTENFPTLVRSLAQLPLRSAWLDGEAVVLDANGRSTFQGLQNALDGKAVSGLSYVAFDVLHLDGVDLRGAALTERKRVLRDLIAGAPTDVRYSEHFDVPGPAFFDNVAKLGLEGMVSKRADARYVAGRSPAWQKIKCPRRDTFVVGGYTDPEGSRQGFGALLLGLARDDGTLDYCGRVGTGFNDATLTSLHRTLVGLAHRDTPFMNPPTGIDARGVHWVKPQLMADVSYGEWTDERTLRHPVFIGLNRTAQNPMPVRSRDDTDDKPAIAAKDTVAGVTISNPDKILYPEAKLTKRDLAHYYESAGEWMLREIRDRPLSLVRFPNGWDQKGFYQKNADASVPKVISRVAVDDEGSLYMMAESVPAIVAMLNLGALEIHPWGSRKNDLAHPDRIVLDLDPDEGLPWADVKQAALLVKTLVENLGLVPYLKTTGGKGLHVVVPIKPTLAWDDVKGFTKAVAEILERTFPDRFTSKLLKVSRGGRVFIDYLRNAEGSTAVAAYSLRAKANAPVSTPIHWSELGKDVRFDYFNSRTVPKRLAKLAEDPWRSLDASARPLTAAVMAKVGYKSK